MNLLRRIAAVIWDLWEHLLPLVSQTRMTPRLLGTPTPPAGRENRPMTCMTCSSSSSITTWTAVRVEGFEDLYPMAYFQYRHCAGNLGCWPSPERVMRRSGPVLSGLTLRPGGLVPSQANPPGPSGRT